MPHREKRLRDSNLERNLGETVTAHAFDAEVCEELHLRHEKKAAGSANSHKFLIGARLGSLEIFK